MGAQIRLLLMFDAFSRISGEVLARSVALSLAFAKQHINFTAAESGCSRGSTGPRSRPAPGAASGTRLSPPESHSS